MDHLWITYGSPITYVSTMYHLCITYITPMDHFFEIRLSCPRGKKNGKMWCPKMRCPTIRCPKNAVSQFRDYIQGYLLSGGASVELYGEAWSSMVQHGAVD
jgi:hypothetical protein